MQRVSSNKFSICIVLIGLMLAVGFQSLAQTQSPTEKVRNSPRLEQHSNFFKPTVYDLQNDAKSKDHFPKGLGYLAYSAVGYDLANSIMLVDLSDGGIVIIDTLGDQETSTNVIKNQFRPVLAEISKKYGFKYGDKLPFKALIYTHNHIDHTGGVEGFLKAADRPPCAPVTSKTQGQDGSMTTNPKCVEIIGQENIVESVVITGTVAGNIINPRSAYMYGSILPNGPVNDGIGPQVNKGNPGPGFRMPSRTFSNELLVTAGKIKMKLIYVPSETNDELAVFLPNSQNKKGGAASSKGNGGKDWGGEGLLQSAEVIQGPSFPNLYSLRGTSYRNPATWFRSVDQLRKFTAYCMVPSHGVPLCGNDNVQLLLKNFRDAIQFTHDQAVRRMNQGHTPPEMAEIIKLPDYLINDLEKLLPAMPSPDMNPMDYLTPFYGSVPQAVRELYFGYVGWFEADPTGLMPNAPKDLAARTVKMMGGRDKILAVAKDAISLGDKTQDKAEWQWAAELLTNLIRINNDDREARLLKATALLKMGQPTTTNPAEYHDYGITSTDPNWRNWFLTSAMELSLPNGKHFPAITGGLVSPDIQAALPPGAWVNSWTMRLNSDKSQNSTPMSVGFEFPPTPGYESEGTQRFVLNLRKAISQFWVISPWSASDHLAAADPKKDWDNTQVVIQMTRSALRNLLVAENAHLKNKFDREQKGERPVGDPPFLTALKQAIEKGEIKLLKGTVDQAVAFFSNFDERLSYAPFLTVR
ncbi:MAG: alkyl sulfatase dimerization domain-containing protein [Acidobacteriota bacterium]|nr:alkyl sulfatase dimerization domain-containing protein [Acidobacteriota bacterium]